MKAEDIKNGGIYLVKYQSGKLVEVRVDLIQKTENGWGQKRRKMTRYMCTNLRTGRGCIIKSAAKFRSKTTDPRKPDRQDKVSTSSSKPNNQNIPKEGEQRSDPTTDETKTEMTPTFVNTTNLGGSAKDAEPSPSVGDRCKWEPKNELGYPMFRINDKVYDFQLIPEGACLSYLDEKFHPVTYTVTCNRAGIPTTCSCPDATERKNTQCKHVRALKAAMAAAPYPLN